MTYVCVFAHQDDEMRCLGTLLRLHNAGEHIAFVTVSAGDKGLAFGTAEEQAAAAMVREREMSSVAARFDAEYRCLGREDGFVYDDDALRRELIVTLRELHADVIFTHWTNDYNSDHVVTAKAVVDAALFTNLGSFEPRSTPLPAVPRIFHVNPGDGYGFEATHFVSLADRHVTAKQEIVRLHASQMDVMRQLRGDDYADEMRREDQRTGARLLVPAAESFRPCLSERRIPWPADLPGTLSRTTDDASDADR